MTHMYFSARAEGRISYGHLGRTDSCFTLHCLLVNSRILYIDKLSLVWVSTMYCKLLKDVRNVSLIDLMINPQIQVVYSKN